MLKYIYTFKMCKKKKSEKKMNLKKKLYIKAKKVKKLKTELIN